MQKAAAQAPSGGEVGNPRPAGRWPQVRRPDALRADGLDVRLLHGFWDSWIHERDVLLARGAEHPTDGDATAYATAYGGIHRRCGGAVVRAARVQEELKLAGDGGGIFEVDSRDGVTLTVHRATVTGPLAAQVTDALAGRSQTGAELGSLPAGSRTARLHTADFFRSPAGS